MKCKVCGAWPRKDGEPWCYWCWLVWDDVKWRIGNSVKAAAEWGAKRRADAMKKDGVK